MFKNYFIIAIIITITWGCVDSAVDSPKNLNADINGSTVVYSLNSKFKLELDVHSDGGYQWFINMSDSTIIAIDSIRYRPKGDKFIVGGLTVETISFTAQKTGSSLFTLEERRSWEKEINPVNRIQFVVSIR